MPARLWSLWWADAEEKYGPQRIAGNGREAEASMNHVEVVNRRAAAGTDRDEQPQRGLDTERAQVCIKGNVMGMERGSASRRNQSGRLHLAEYPLGVLITQPRPEAAATVRNSAGLPRPIRHRRQKPASDRNSIRPTFARGTAQQRDSSGDGGYDRHHIRILERRAGAHIGAVS